MVVENFTAEKIIQDRIFSFMRKMILFCQERKIKPSIENFVSYKTDPNQYLPDSFNLLISEPSFLVLGNSRIFLAFYNSLDVDIKNTICDLRKIKKAQYNVMINKTTKNLIKKLLKKDYIFN